MIRKMRLSCWGFLITLIFFTNISFADPQLNAIDVDLTLDRIELDLLAKYKAASWLESFDNDVDHDTVFLEALRTALQDSATMNYPFGRLRLKGEFRGLPANQLGHALNSSAQQGILILTSKDKRLRLYTWDTVGGGTMHAMAGLVQWRDSAGAIHVQPFQTKVVYYDLHQIDLNGNTIYLTFGWGTWGGGGQHIVADVFALQESKLKRGLLMFQFQGELRERLFFGLSRNDPFRISYDSRGRMLTFSSHPDFPSSVHSEMVTLQLWGRQFKEVFRVTDRPISNTKGPGHRSADQER